MIVTAIHTNKVLANKMLLTEVIDKYLPKMPDKSVLAITSKIVSICEGRVYSGSLIDKNQSVIKEAEYYLPEQYSRYGHRFTISRGLLSVDSGIDESNVSGGFVLWPEDAQKTANDIRKYLLKRFDLNNLGVVITDSTCTPMRWGTTGVFLAHSGFVALKDYVGRPDLFGRPMQVSKGNIAGGLAAAAVLAMGEGSEQTPLAVLQDLPFVEFQDRNPTESEIKNLYIKPDDDLFAPFLNSVRWRRGGRQA